MTFFYSSNNIIKMGRELRKLPEDLETLIAREGNSRTNCKRDARVAFRKHCTQKRYDRKMEEKEALLKLIDTSEDFVECQLAKLAIVDDKVKKLKEPIPFNESKEKKKMFLCRWKPEVEAAAIKKCGSFEKALEVARTTADKDKN
jgi:hypothetical protein